MAEIFFLLSKVGKGNKLYFIKNVHLLLKKFRPFIDFDIIVFVDEYTVYGT